MRLWLTALNNNNAPSITEPDRPHLFTASHTFWNPPFLMINLARDKNCCQPFCCLDCEPNTSHQTRVTRRRSQTRREENTIPGSRAYSLQGSNPRRDSANWLQTSDKFWRINLTGGEEKGEGGVLICFLRRVFFGSVSCEIWGEGWETREDSFPAFSQNNRNPFSVHLFSPFCSDAF